MKDIEKSPLTWKSSLNPISISWVRGSKWPRNSDPKPSVGHMSLAEIIHHECWCGCVVRELVCEGFFVCLIGKGIISSPMFVDLILERFCQSFLLPRHVMSCRRCCAGANTYPNSGKHISAFNVSCLDFLDIIFCAILYISYLSHWNESFNADVLFISSYAVSNSKIH